MPVDPNDKCWSYKTGQERNKCWIENRIEAANYCSTDNDCTIANFGCPYGCNSLVNVKKVKAIQDFISELDTNNCEYKCRGIDVKPICKDNKCVIP